MPSRGFALSHTDRILLFLFAFCIPSLLSVLSSFVDMAGYGDPNPSIPVLMGNMLAAHGLSALPPLPDNEDPRGL
jgi:hypothetical protein